MTSINQSSEGKRFSLETIIVCASAILVGGIFFLPWIGKAGVSLSGLDLTLQGYPYLSLLPLAAFIAFYQILKSPGRRPTLVMFMAVLGLLVVVLFLSSVLNYDSGVLSLVKDDQGHKLIRYTGLDRPLFFGLISGWTVPFYLNLIGLLGIYLAVLTRPKANLPRAKVRPDQHQTTDLKLDSLEDLRASWEIGHEYKISALWLTSLAVLIFTCTWCGISAVKLWENRGHARDYLFGRELSQADKDYITDQTRRAPEIEAQGRARAFQDNKYRGIPIAEQPTLEEKFEENERLVAKYLAEMTEAQKEKLRQKARISALEEKKGGYFPPETAWLKIKGYLIALVETVAIAIWGTLLAVICAVPASLFAAQNTLELIISGEGKISRSLRSFCVFGVRRFLDACRGFNEFVMALIFVAVIGLGPFAGILALWIHTFGILAKVFSEQIEAIEEGQIEALSSTGASVDQVIAFSVLPQVMPGFVSYALLRFESNVRSAAILGFVGAGGIGFLIFDKLNGYLFREVATMMMIIIIAVGIIDHLCGILRNRFI